MTQPETPDTVTEAVALLRRDGYLHDLDVGPAGISAPSGTEPFPTAIVERTYRFEGPSDPADEAIVLGVRCVSKGVRGVVVAGYGASADPEHDAVMARLLRPAEPAGRTATDRLATVLDELIDLVQEMKQVRWTFGAGDAHGTIEATFDTLISSIQRVAVLDERSDAASLQVTTPSARSRPPLRPEGDRSLLDVAARDIARVAADVSMQSHDIDDSAAAAELTAIATALWGRAAELLDAAARLR